MGMVRLRWAVAAVAGVAGVFAAEAAKTHTADQDANNVVSLSELLRVIQFYNVGSYHCAAGTEDGFEPGPGDQSCTAHESDYNTQDWKVSLSELLRLIQFYNFPGYFVCPEGEDSYCVRNRAERPNVLFLVLDTLRGDMIGKTRDGELIVPFLTELASQGLYFPNAITPSSWTEPTMSSVFTGRHPNRYVESIPQGPGGQSTGFEIAEEDETLAEWMGLNGYDVWGIMANAFLNIGLPLSQGFSADQFAFFNGGLCVTLTQQALDWAEENKLQEPFLLYMQYMDPHGPYAPPVDLEHPFDPEPALTGSDAVNLAYSSWGMYATDLNLAYFGADPRNYADLTATGIDVLQSRYDRDCWYMDTELRRLVEGVLERYPNTYIVVTADHGDSYFDRFPLIGHGQHLFQEQIHVPWIIVGPGISPEVDTRRVSNLSALPTLARLLEISPEDLWEGRDLIYYEDVQPEFAYTKSTFFGNAIEASVCIEGDLKLIEDTKQGEPLLFDLAADPGELNNLADTHPEDLAALQALLDEHLASVTKSLP